MWYDKLKIEDLSSYRTGVWLSERPCHVKGLKDYICPKDAMLELLTEVDLTKHTTKQADNSTILNSKLLNSKTLKLSI